MDKFSVRNEEEYVKLFRNFDMNDAESFMGIEFAFLDGTYPDNTEDENQDVSRDVFRKLDESYFPDSYPCVVLMAHEKDFDRHGSTEFRCLEFVYLVDFQR
jgi:hypothetical protein